MTEKEIESIEQLLMTCWLDFIERWFAMKSNAFNQGFSGFGIVPDIIPDTNITKDPVNP